MFTILLYPSSYILSKFKVKTEFAASELHSPPRTILSFRSRASGFYAFYLGSLLGVDWKFQSMT